MKLVDLIIRRDAWEVAEFKFAVAEVGEAILLHLDTEPGCALHEDGEPMAEWEIERAEAENGPRPEIARLTIDQAIKLVGTFTPHPGNAKGQLFRIQCGVILAALDALPRFLEPPIEVILIIAEIMSAESDEQKEEEEA
jgi:hypothetical protein